MPPGFGEPAPWFQLPTLTVEQFSFHTLGGRHVVLDFLGSMSERALARRLQRVRSALPAMSRSGCVYLAVSPRGEMHARVYTELLPSCHLFMDKGGHISGLYGIDPVGVGGVAMLLDERLRVLATFSTPEDDPAGWVGPAMSVLQQSGPLEGRAGSLVPAPVLLVPRVFEHALCDRLVAFYHEGPSAPSGFMRDVGGRTTLLHDPAHKRRRDRVIAEQALKLECRSRIRDRLLPEIAKAFQFQATRIERYLVACYDAADAGHFRAHRDNTTLGTAHRRFAVSLNLNTDAYEGGKLRFPEFGNQLYEAPKGGAVVFSCSLLHEATPVIRGRRYAFLPFLYDEASARLRERNAGSIATAAEEDNTGSRE